MNCGLARCARSKAHRKELVDPKITQHRCRIVKTIGDEMLVEFVSVSIRCTVDIQRGMAGRNADLQAGKRVDSALASRPISVHRVSLAETDPIRRRRFESDAASSNRPLARRSVQMIERRKQWLNASPNRTIGELTISGANDAAQCTLIVASLSKAPNIAV